MSYGGATRRKPDGECTPIGRKRSSGRVVLYHMRRGDSRGISPDGIVAMWTRATKKRIWHMHRIMLLGVFLIESSAPRLTRRERRGHLRLPSALVNDSPLETVPCMRRGRGRVRRLREPAARRSSERTRLTSGAVQAIYAFARSTQGKLTFGFSNILFLREAKVGAGSSSEPLGRGMRPGRGHDCDSCS